jgi:uncharacterized protein (TIGR02453 family)
MSLHRTLDFLRDLAANNNREWFNDNRRRYEEARAAFEALIDAVFVGFDQVDTFRPMTAKDVIHRINRDVRFSADKSPYNTAMSAVIGPDGRKSLSRLYYIRLEPGDQTITASGAISLSAQELQDIREAIMQDAQPLRAITEAATFQQRSSRYRLIALQRVYGAAQVHRRRRGPPRFCRADHRYMPGAQAIDDVFL